MKENDSYLILSGGDPAKVGITEAQVMARIADDEYVDSAKVILENEARSTVQNFLYGFKIITQLCNDQGPVHVTIVTSDYHAARTFYVAHSVLRSMDLRLELEVVSAFTQDEEYRKEKFTGELASLQTTVNYLLNKYQLKPLPQNYFLTALSMIEKK